MTDFCLAHRNGESQEKTEETDENVEGDPIFRRTRSLLIGRPNSAPKAIVAESPGRRLSCFERKLSIDLIRFEPSTSPENGFNIKKPFKVYRRKSR